MKDRFNSKQPVSLLAVLVFVALLLAACQPTTTTLQPTTVPLAANTAIPTSVPTMVNTATTASKPTSTAAASATTPTVLVPQTGGIAAGAATLMVAKDPTLGSILVDGKGMTLYIFTKDEADKSPCTGGCLQAWPPFLTNGAPAAGEGVDASLLGTTTLADGSTIVTYNHMPLYYWAADTKPGDTSGQGVNNVWYVVAPDGKPAGIPQSSADPYDSDY